MFLQKFVPIRARSASSVVREDGSVGTALSDTLKLQTPAHGIHFLAAGEVTIVDEDGNQSKIQGLAGNDYARLITQVRATGTTVTAANLVLLWGV
jgi:hypothetical protein